MLWHSLLKADSVLGSSVLPLSYSLLSLCKSKRHTGYLRCKQRCSLRGLNTHANQLQVKLRYMGNSDCRRYCNTPALRQHLTWEGDLIWYQRRCPVLTGREAKKSRWHISCRRAIILAPGTLEKCSEELILYIILTPNKCHNAPQILRVFLTLYSQTKFIL